MVWGDGRRGEPEADALACLALFFIGGFRGRGDLRRNMKDRGGEWKRCGEVGVRGLDGWTQTAGRVVSSFLQV